MKIAYLALAGSIALLSAGLTPASAQTKDPAMDKLVADFTAAFNKGDAKGVAGLYSENAIRVTPDGKVLGRSAIEKEFAANFAGMYKGTKLKITMGTTQYIGTDFAVGEGTYEVSGIMGADGKPAPAVQGRYVNALVKKGAAWQLAGNAGILPAPVATK